MGDKGRKALMGRWRLIETPDSKDVTCWSVWFTNFRKNQNHLGVEVMSLKSRFLGPPQISDCPGLAEDPGT